MSALLDSLADGFNGPDARRAMLDAAVRDGLPDARSESWKYTSLRALAQRRFAPVDVLPAIDPELAAMIPSPRLVFVNGRYAAQLSDTAALPEGIALTRLSERLEQEGYAKIRPLHRRFPHRDDVFARVNGALADEGVWLRVEEYAEPAAPLHLVFIATETGTDHAWHPRHLFDIRHGATLSLFEHHLSIGAPAHMDNSMAHVHLKQGARLHHARIQHHASTMTSLLRTDAVLARDACYQRIDLELGAKMSRHEFNVRLEGDHARLNANGILLSHDRRHLDTRLGIEHIAENTFCELNWRGIATDHGRTVFHGSIHIRQGADGSNASLSNKNLLLSADAEVDTQPVLVINADDVKAAHGATVGQLDANALFYLYSRGIPETQARKLLTAAFCREPLGIADAETSGLLMQLLDQALSTAGMA
ncbi:MAG: Fe-S cluster assembly protein SufD [Xanthomonadaceae bacterium]|jgi:Fe-S cluster assembly protein SufD|nr:Fe-S cluster assembly protein SufD [Xanthomonadaceae bacterium]